ncbi:hypothetical protein AVEN_126045-1 [Araneus ventricosus]|uniref:Uncharacterized protein n=1 Tax=Araneus ventricosus TaxID=182803 RepID=A0A4Y2EUY6_ARAVE|nr:hypothetical protein AVEN_126045-1 [Araneus ventricosus]
MENSTAALKSRISNLTKLRQFGFFGDTSRHIKQLTRSTPCYEGSKSEIRGVRKGIGGSKISCRGGKKIALPYSQRTLELQVNGRARFFELNGRGKNNVGTNGWNGVQMNCRLYMTRQFKFEIRCAVHLPGVKRT